jgi:hypothetical protein
MTLLQLRGFVDLERSFRGNLHSTLHAARLQLELNQLVEAQATFSRVRTLAGIKVLLF